MKRFILHVGFHKTATSSIQKTCSKNQKILDRQGYLYPYFYNSFGHELVNHSIPLYSAYCKKPELYAVNIKSGETNRIAEVNARYLNKFDEILREDRHVILSGEDISVLHHEALMDIQEKIISSGFKLEVYCSVRKPYSFTCSELQEQIKSGVGTIESFKFYSQAEKIIKLKSVFKEKICFFNFEKDCEGDGPVENFLSRVGVDVGGISVVKNNEGFGNLSTRALSHLNSFHPMRKNGKINKNGRRVFKDSVDKEKFLLTHYEFSRIEKILSKENHLLAELLGSEFTESRFEFSKEISIELDSAVALFNAYSEIKTAKALLSFIDKHSTFSLSEIVNYIEASADTYRDIGLVLEGTDIEQALIMMKKAHNLRPNGPFIKKKIQFLQTKLDRLDVETNAFR